MSQRELRARIQQVVGENQPRGREQGDQGAAVPRTYLSYDEPEVKLDQEGKVLWFEFGIAMLDGETYVLGTPGDPPPDDDALPPEGPEDAPRLGPYYFPIKAQLLVEVIRKHRSDSRAAWEPVLQEVEAVIALELKAIDAPPGPVPAEGPRAGFHDSEDDLENLLRDCDERVYRLVAGHLDRVAKERGLIVRRLPQLAQGAPLLTFEVKLLADPPAEEFYVISDFKFWCLRRKGNEGDFKLWDKVADGTASIAGDCHVAAVWKQGERTVTSDITPVNRITRDTQLRLRPRAAPAPR
jgi:hypothetical protein